MSSSVFKNLIKRADEACSEYVRKRDSLRQDTGGMCFFCGLRPIECAAHIFHRSKYGTRFNPEAMRGSCFSCNGMFEENPVPFLQKFSADVGPDACETLDILSYVIPKHSRGDLEGIIKDFRKRTRDLK